jgi:rRNA-processing protein EBP2
MLARTSKRRKADVESESDQSDAELDAEMEALRAVRREKGLPAVDADSDDEEEGYEEDSGDEEGGGLEKKNEYNREAMEKCLKDMGELPFIETQAVSAFRVEVKDEHDDLEREMAFYNHSVLAVEAGYKQLKALDVPTVRPEDYFCENVKSDSHMNKIKDRLLLEEKKIDALEARKARDMNKKYSRQMDKEKKADKTANKGKKGDPKDGEDEKGKKFGGGERVGQGRFNPNRARKDTEEEAKVGGNRGGEKSGKRVAMDKKYGFGGKARRASKLTDKKSLNDMSAFNPRAGKDGRPGGSKGGKGGKGGAYKASGSAGRPGKNSRDKKRGGSGGGKR